MDEKKSKRTEFKEIGRIRALNRLFANTNFVNSDVQECFSDEREDYNYLTTSRVLLEGIDFDLTYTPLKYLGHKAVINSVGPLYARCYKPYKLSFNIAISAKLSYEQVDWLWTGIRAAAKTHGVENITLELRPSLTGLTISSCAIGRQKRSIVEKFPSVQKNSLICITGEMGAAYMGLHVLEREKAAFNNSKQPDLSKYKYILSRYLTPEIDNDMLERFAEEGFYPATGYFMTKGLGDAVKQLAYDTSLGARIFVEKIPIATQAREMAQEINIDIITAVVNGGDDYRILWVIPLERHEQFLKAFPEADIIGHLAEPSFDEAEFRVAASKVREEVTPQLLQEARREAAVNSCSLVAPDGEVTSIVARGWE